MSTEKIHEDPQHLVFIQSRAAINHTLVAEYAAMMRARVEFEAAQGIQAEDGQVYVYDGQHRGEAVRVAGMQLLVEVRPGSQEEAEWQALAANQKHGLRRTRADKQRVVGVNGSRRWCLNCDAEWPTAAAFLTAAMVTHNASNADKNN